MLFALLGVCEVLDRRLPRSMLEGWQRAGELARVCGMGGGLLLHICAAIRVLSIAMPGWQRGSKHTHTHASLKLCSLLSKGLSHRRITWSWS